MLQKLIKADQSLSSKRVKAKSDLQSQWDKILPKAEKELEKYILKDSQANKDITKRVADAFAYALDDADLGGGYKFGGLKVTGGKFSRSLDNEDTRASFEVFADLTIKADKSITLEEAIQDLESTQESFSENLTDDGYLVLEGYSPITEDEVVTFLALEAGDTEFPDDERKEELQEQLYENVDLTSGGYEEFGGGFSKIVKGGNGTFTVPVYLVFDWNLALA